MIKRLLKLVAWLTGGVAGLIVLALIVALGVFESRRTAPYRVAAHTQPVPGDPAALAEGARLFTTRGCVDCHGANGAGVQFIDPGLIGSASGANLTRGRNGLPADYSINDFHRAVRHGVGRDNRALLIMPANDYYYMSDDDLGRLFAHVRGLTPVDTADAKPQALTLLGRILTVLGQVPTFPAETINHAARRPDTPPVGATVDYGKYMSFTCVGCHGNGFGGGPVPGAPDNAPPAANLTPAGNLARWSEADFARTLRTGTTPEGRQLDPRNMPWTSFAQFTDTEIRALYLYLKTVAPRPDGSK